MLWRTPKQFRPAGFIKPCLAVLADEPPSGPLWTHEIKHDGYRIIARKYGDEVRLWSRNGRDWTGELVGITEAVRALPAASLMLDGEAVAHCLEGLPDFHGLRSRDGAATACLYAFDLLMREGEDLRGLPLDERRIRLGTVLDGAGPALRPVEHLEGDGEVIFRHACQLGLEGIVSKRRDRPYRSGRTDAWRKIRNPTYARP